MQNNKYGIIFFFNFYVKSFYNLSFCLRTPVNSHKKMEKIETCFSVSQRCMKTCLAFCKARIPYCPSKSVWTVLYWPS